MRHALWDFKTIYTGPNEPKKLNRLNKHYELKKPWFSKMPSLPKQAQRKVLTKRDTTVRKKKSFSYKSVRRKVRFYWSEYWEIIVTVLTAIFLSLFILPKFLQ